MKINFSPTPVQSTAIFVGTLMLYGCSGGSNPTAQLEAKIAEIRESGAPVSVDELDALYDAGPRGRDAGLALASLGKRYTLPNEAIEDDILVIGFLPDPGELIPERVERVTRAHIADNRAVLNELEYVLDTYDRFRFPITLNDGAMTDLGHLAPIRTGTRLLSMRALLAADEGDAQAAVDDLLHGLKLANSTEVEPTLISQLVRVACMAIVFDVIDDVIERCDISTNQLEALFNAIVLLDFEGFVSGVLPVERAWSLDEDILDDMAELSGTGTTEIQQAIDEHGDEYADLELLNYLYAFDNLIAIRDYPTHEWATQIEGIEAAMDQMSVHGYRMSVDTIPQLARAYLVELRILALQRVAICGLAAAIFREANRHLPSSLTKLVPEYLDSMPVDPFTGGLLRSTFDGAAFVVYSVGDDGDDDGGRDPAEGLSLQEDGDIWFRVAPASVRAR